MPDDKEIKPSIRPLLDTAIQPLTDAENLRREVLPLEPLPRGFDDKLLPRTLPEKGLLHYGALHSAPPAIDQARILIFIDHHMPSVGLPLHKDNGPAHNWRDFVIFHEEGHGRGEGTKFLPNLNINPEFEDDRKFGQLTRELETRNARVSAVAAMLSKPVDAYDIARATSSVTFMPTTTLAFENHRSLTAVWSGVSEDLIINERMRRPDFASKPLEAATAVAIVRGDASALRGTYNYKHD